VFEDAVGLLAQQLNHTAVGELTGISWATVGSIAEWLVEEKLHEDRFEGMNNKIRLLSHRAFGFHSPHPLIATIYLCCSAIELPELQVI
jgi:hypothetical protein